MIELIASPRQRAFGQAKRDAPPQHAWTATWLRVSRRLP
jgi:hypothetical protein